MKKIFLDTEFTGLHQKTTLISIALISECGKTFYAEFADYDKTQVDDWIQENVIDQLRFTKNLTHAISSWELWLSDKGKYSNALEMQLAVKDMSNFECIGITPMIKNRLEKWLEQFDEVEIWSDCLAYDWVLFCNIFGHAFDIPENIYYIPFDICTLFKAKNIDPGISREEYASFPETNLPKHNALHDAIIIKACYEKLTSCNKNRLTTEEATKYLMEIASKNDRLKTLYQYSKGDWITQQQFCQLLELS